MRLKSRLIELLFDFPITDRSTAATVGKSLRSEDAQRIYSTNTYQYYNLR